jgi:IclR family pca regulon transcriptional regulator
MRNETVRAFADGLRAIEAFESVERRLTLSEVAARAGLTRAAARRYLHTLCALGYGAREGRYFSLTPRVMKLGYAFMSATSLPSLAQPLLEQVGAQTGEVVALAILDGPEVVFLARSTPRKTIPSLTGIGGRLSAFYSSSGRVLLAAERDSKIERLMRELDRPKRLTAKKKASYQDSLREIRRARRVGYAINNEETELGLVSIAVPVLTPRGAAVAAISLSSRASEMSLSRMGGEALSFLQAASRSLTEQL